MTQHYTLICGDVSSICHQLPPNSFDGCLTDPPYGIRFMGKRWDYQIPQKETWGEIARVLKPGAPVLSFGGCRTYHRLVCAVEDGGLEICDQIDWIFAKGMPHPASTCDHWLDKYRGETRKVIGTRVLSGNAAVSLKEKGGTYGIQAGTAGNVTVKVTEPSSEIAKRWAGHGMALSPAHEPICLACKPFDGSIAHNIDKWGCGGWAIDDCRIGFGDYTQEEWEKKGASRTNGPAGIYSGVHRGSRTINRWRDGAKPFGGGAGHQYESVEVTKGRWPKNLIIDPDVGGEINRRLGDRVSRRAVGRNGGGGKIFGKSSGGLKVDTGYDETGGPSRFFYSVKVNTKEREAGCESIPILPGKNCHNDHVTLKPIGLTTYLGRLGKPPDHYRQARLLVPFSGAGSEMIGALKAGWPIVVGIELDQRSIEIARARIRHWCPDAIEKPWKGKSP